MAHGASSYLADGTSPDMAHGASSYLADGTSSYLADGTSSYLAHGASSYLAGCAASDVPIFFNRNQGGSGGKLFQLYKTNKEAASSKEEKR